MKTAVQKLGAAADWTSIEKTTNGQFVRVIAPDNGYATDGGWPSMVPYIENFAKSLPLHGTTYGPFTVEDRYSASPGHDVGNDGWFDYQGYFNKTTFALTLTGALGATTTPGGAGSFAGSAVTVTLTGATGLAKGIYDQGHEYKVGGVQDLTNDVYARIWNDLTGAFNYGYWGSTYGSGTDTKDFFGTFAPPVAPSGGQPAFLPDRTVPFVTASPSVAYNLYSSVLGQFSPNYTFPENENYGSGGKGISPLMSIPAGGEVKAILPPDGWTGPSGSSTCKAAVTPTGPTTGTTTVTPTATGKGYYEVASDGGIFAFGNAQFYGSMGGKPLNQPIVGIAATPTGGGYYEVASDGGIFAFGNAQFYGSMGGKPLNKPIVGMASTPTGGGYWEVASDGGIFAFGTATFYGSMGGKPLNQPIVGIAATSTGGGYYEVASDGGIFSFGDAIFYGSMGGKPLNKPIVGIAPAPEGQGYWEVASDGGLFAFGTAPFYGSMGGKPLNQPVVGMASTLGGGGYYEVASDGGIFAFGNAQFYGSMGGKPLNKPIVGIGLPTAGGLTANVIR
jgi:ribosomal protein L24E